MWSSVLGIFHSACFQFSSMLHVTSIHSFLCWLIFHCMTTPHFVYPFIHLLMEFGLFPLFGYYEVCYFSSTSPLQYLLRHRYRLPFGINYLSCFWWILSINFQQLQSSVTLVWDLRLLWRLCYLHDLGLMFGYEGLFQTVGFFSLWSMII